MNSNNVLYPPYPYPVPILIPPFIHLTCIRIRGKSPSYLEVEAAYKPEEDDHEKDEQ